MTEEPNIEARRARRSLSREIKRIQEAERIGDAAMDTALLAEAILRLRVRGDAHATASWLAAIAGNLLEEAERKPQGTA